MNKTWKCAKCETNNYSELSRCFICGTLREQSDVWERELREKSAVLEAALAAARAEKGKQSDLENKTDKSSVSAGVKSVVIKPESYKPERVRSLSADIGDDERIFKDASDEEDFTPDEDDMPKNIIRFVILIILIVLTVLIFMSLV